LSGAIQHGRFGEVSVKIRGGRECFYAVDADGGTIPADTEVIIIDYQPPRTVIVTRAYPEEEESP
jgi:hypothetical protein